MWMKTAYHVVVPMQESPSSIWPTSLEEGQLSIDMFREENALIIRSPMAGVALEDIDIAIHGDLLTIRGQRASQADTHQDEWFCRECYWGSFSRSIILPLDVQAEQAEASMKNGILDIRLPLRHAGHRITVKHRDS